MADRAASQGVPTPRRPGSLRTAIDILVRIAIGVAVAGIVFFISDVLNISDAPKSTMWGLGLSIFFGGLVLVVQFLLDVAGRLDNLDDRLLKMHQATELYDLMEQSALETGVITKLIENATAIPSASAQILLNFAHAELLRVSDTMKHIAEGTSLSYEGEDRDWLLELTRSARINISATSLTTVDGLRNGFWTSELGRTYLRAQKEAGSRGVDVRRIFVLDVPHVLDMDEFHEICQLHVDSEVSIRFVSPGESIADPLQYDYVLFDGKIAYETIPAPAHLVNHARPPIRRIDINLKLSEVVQKVVDFGDLWDSALEVSEIHRYR